jgi:endoglucanase
MPFFDPRLSISRLSVRQLLLPAAFLSFSLCFCAPAAQAESAYVRVSQVGYEAGESAARGYLMSTAAETGATFKVVGAGGSTAYTGKVGALLGTWANSKKLVYQVYALDFVVPRGRSYSISVSGPVSAHSPKFAVDHPDVLYPGLLVNTLFFYETQRDGPDFIPNALRTGVDTFAKFNGNSGTYDPSQTALFQDNMQSFSTTEPAIDLTATSFLMWS